MAPSSPETVIVQGHHVGIKGGRLHLTPAGAPAEVRVEVKRRSDELIAALLRVPENLADWTLGDMKALAWRMSSYIDGPAPYEERICFMSEYLRLVERINFRMEGNPS